MPITPGRVDRSSGNLPESKAAVFLEDAGADTPVAVRVAVRIWIERLTRQLAHCQESAGSIIRPARARAELDLVPDQQVSSLGVGAVGHAAHLQKGQRRPTKEGARPNN